MIKAAIGLAFLLLLALGMVLIQPGEYIVRRQAVMTSSPAEVYRILADFREWDAWAQLQRVENSLANANKEAKEGPASLTWSTKEEDGTRWGAGRLTFIDAKPGKSVRVRIDLTQPYAAQGEIVFEIEADGYESTLRATVKMQNNFLGKAQFLVSDRSETVAAEMEASLKRITKIAEAWTKFRKSNPGEK